VGVAFKGVEYTVRTTAVTLPVPSADLWLSRSHTAHPGGLPLICLPNAGGSASQFFSWARLLPPDIDVWPVQLPGRENRLRETPLSQMDTLVEAIAEALAPNLSGPFAIFGHSLGGLVGFELARMLRRRYGLEPAHLLVSARRAPHLPHRFGPIHRLPDEMFLDELARRYNGIPDLIRQDPELLSIYLPMLRADVTIFETYVWAEEPPLNCPITVYGGRDDTSVAYDELVAWAAHSTHRGVPKLFPGGHFYLQAARQELLAEISRSLAGSLEKDRQVAP
jgi:medium-chain acyl-[acyl-carrier-protein] hydrolase